MPQDVKLSPDGRIFYVADMMSNGGLESRTDDRSVTGFIPTGPGRMVCTRAGTPATSTLRIVVRALSR